MTEALEDRPIAAMPASPGRYRNVIALTMLLLACIGAVIAGWTAIKQQASTALGRRIAQAQMLELSDRARMIQESQVAARLLRRLQGHIAEAQLQRAAADRSRAGDVDQARLMDLKSSEAFLLAGASRPFLSYLPSMINDAVTVDERRIGLAATVTLQRKGIRASWSEPVESAPASTPGTARVDPDSGVQGRLEYAEKGLQETIDGQVIGLSLIVVGFVMALVMLTFADLSTRRRGISNALYGAGLLAAVTSLCIALSIDPGLLPLIGGILIMFLLFVCVCYALGWLGSATEAAEPSPPQSIDAQGFSGSALQSQGRADRFSRAMVVGIATAALVSSVIGYWYALANARTDDAAQAAYEQEIDVVRRVNRAATATLGTFEAMIELYESRIRCQSARNRTALALDGKITLSANVTEAEMALRCEEAESREKVGLPGLTFGELDRLDGPQADARFPFRLQQRVVAATASADANEPLAMWDGHSERASFWSGKATTLLACLTIVAIALYIFGQSLAMSQVKATLAMAGCAVAMTVAAMGWSVAVWIAPDVPSRMLGDTCLQPEAALGSPAHLPAESLLRTAAINYAAGVTEAHAALDEAEFQKAISHLQCAVMARPNFAQAHVELGEARAISQSAHRSNSYYSLPSKERLEDMLSNARATLAIAAMQGIEPNAYALNTHAVALWAIGIRDGKADLIRDALAAVDRAIAWAEPLETNRRRVARDQSRNYYPWLSIVPLLHLNRSLFLIADSRIEEARDAAETALTLSVGRDWGLNATMVTANALLDVYCEKLQPAESCVAVRGGVRNLVRALVTGAWDAQSSSADVPKNPLRVALTITPSRVSWSTAMSGVEPEKDRLDVVWSVANTQWGVFDALPQLKPAVGAGQLRRGTQGHYTASQNALAASDFKRCLAPGRYRVEFYRNGLPLARAEAELAGPPLEAARIEPLNLALCRPVDWKPWQPKADHRRRHEPMAGFTTADGRPTAFLFAVPLPEASDAAATIEQSTYTVDRALQLMAENGIVEGSLADLKARLSGCQNPPGGGLIQAVAKGAGGIAYAAIVLADGIDREYACDLVNSITIMHGLPR